EEPRRRGGRRRRFGRVRAVGPSRLEEEGGVSGGRTHPGQAGEENGQQRDPTAHGSSRAQVEAMLSAEMFRRFITSWRVVGLSWSSSAARFCPPPEAWRALITSWRSYSETVSLNATPAEATEEGGRTTASGWRTACGRRSTPSTGPVDRTTARSTTFS